MDADVRKVEYPVRLPTIGNMPGSRSFMRVESVSALIIIIETDRGRLIYFNKNKKKESV